MCTYRARPNRSEWPTIPFTGEDNVHAVQLVAVLYASVPHDLETLLGIWTDLSCWRVRSDEDCAFRTAAALLHRPSLPFSDVRMRFP